MSSLEICNGNIWTSIVDANDLQAAVILPVVATGTSNAANVISELDGVTISKGDMVLLTSQPDSTENGIYIVNINSNTRISPQPIGAYILNGQVQGNKLFFNTNNSQNWVELNQKLKTNKKKNK